MKVFVALAISIVPLFAALAQTSAPEYGFLTERVSITNKDGIIAFPPGTRVYILEHHGSKMSVKAEDKTFDVSQTQITSDAAQGATLREQDAAR